MTGVADAVADEAAWCWATQTVDALVTMQKLVTEAIAAGADTIDPDALATPIHRYHSAAHLGSATTPHGRMR
ncbi:MAG: hypothetical protein ACRDU4_01080 [Mycobacterium sp.]